MNFNSIENLDEKQILEMYDDIIDTGNSTSGIYWKVTCRNGVTFIDYDPIEYTRFTGWCAYNRNCGSSNMGLCMEFCRVKSYYSTCIYAFGYEDYRGSYEYFHELYGK